MSLELRFAAAQRKQHRKRQQLARPGIQPAASDVITETIHRQVILYVFLALGGRFAQGVDMSCAENGLLDGQSPFEPRPGRGRRLSFERKRHAARHQHIVGDMYEIEHLGHPHVRHRLVEDFLRLDGRHAGVERPCEHRPELGLPLRGDTRCEDAHHPRRGIEVAVTGDFAECKVIKNFD